MPKKAVGGLFAAVNRLFDGIGDSARHACTGLAASAAVVSADDSEVKWSVSKTPVSSAANDNGAAISAVIVTATIRGLVVLSVS